MSSMTHCIANAIGVGLLGLWSSFAGAAESARPNVVFILADDLGYGDVKCFGGDRCQIETPHFDRVAREGMRFTDARSTASVCVPSRVATFPAVPAFVWKTEPAKPSAN